jgi:hypothetical protein
MKQISSAIKTLLMALNDVFIIKHISLLTHNESKPGNVFQLNMYKQDDWI